MIHFSNVFSWFRIVASACCTLILQPYRRRLNFVLLNSILFASAQRYIASISTCKSSTSAMHDVICCSGVIRKTWDKCCGYLSETKSSRWNGVQARRDSAMPLLRELHWSVIVCHTRSLSWRLKRSTLICLLLTYSSACRFIHLSGLFAPRTATLLFRVDPTLQLAIVLSSTRLPQFGMRYLSRLHLKTHCYHSKQPWRLTFVHRHTRDHTVLISLEQCYTFMLS